MRRSSPRNKSMRSCEGKDKLALGFTLWGQKRKPGSKWAQTARKRNKLKWLPSWLVVKDGKTT